MDTGLANMVEGDAQGAATRLAEEPAYPVGQDGQPIEQIMTVRAVANIVSMYIHPTTAIAD